MKTLKERITYLHVSEKYKVYEKDEMKAFWRLFRLRHNRTERDRDIVRGKVSWPYFPHHESIVILNHKKFSKPHEVRITMEDFHKILQGEYTFSFEKYTLEDYGKKFVVIR